MIVGVNIAKRIINDVREIVSFPINFIHTDGIVLASTDEETVGMYIPRSAKVLKEGRKTYFTAQDDGSTVDSVIMPIYFMGDIVAAVEIIGKKEDTVKIDEITRSMAESLVYQTLLKSQRLLKSELKRQVFRQMFQYPDSDLNTVLGRGLVVGLDFEEFDRVIVGMVKGFTYKEVFSDQEEFDEIYNSYKYSFKHHASIETSLVDDQFIGVVNDIPADELEEIIEKVCKDVGDDRLVIGVGKEVSSYKRLRISYDQAIRAINTNVYSSNKNVFMYENLDVELLLGDINEDSKQEFLRKVFKNMNEEDILRIKETLEIYFRNNGSITETAEEMFVHKNTLQYRLNKIAEDTGYNPRVLNEGFILMTAIKMYTL